VLIHEDELLVLGILFGGQFCLLINQLHQIFIEGTLCCVAGYYDLRCETSSAWYRAGVKANACSSSFPLLATCKF
jgi:hypothetical protein